MPTPAEHKAPGIGGSIKPIREKHGSCSNCDKLSSRDQTLRACAACKSVLYCSKECQKAHWPKHRERCQNLQQLKRPRAEAPFTHECQHDHSLCLDPSWPPSLSQQERAVVIHNIVELHRANVHTTVELLRNALRHRGQVLDGTKHALAFTVGYRADNDGNPATQVFIRKAEIVDLSTKGWTNSKDGFERTGLEGFEDTPDRVTVVFRGGGAYGGLMTMLNPVHPSEAAALDEWPMDWIGYMRFSLTTGTLFETRSGTSLEVASMMRKEGKKWKQTEISDEELDDLWDNCWRYMGPDPEVVMGPLSGSLQ